MSTDFLWINNHIKYSCNVALVDFSARLTAPCSPCVCTRFLWDLWFPPTSSNTSRWNNYVTLPLLPIVPGIGFCPSTALTRIKTLMKINDWRYASLFQMYVRIVCLTLIYFEHLFWGLLTTMPVMRHQYPLLAVVSCPGVYLTQKLYAKQQQQKTHRV